MVVGGGEGRDHVRRRSRALLNAYPSASASGVSRFDSPTPSPPFVTFLTHICGGIPCVSVRIFLIWFGSSVLGVLHPS